ncbi:acyl-CoA dehydrogenase family protein [Leucobacter sp. HY1910]
MNMTTGTATAPCMQFRLSEDQEGIVEAAQGVFQELSSDDRVVAGEEAVDTYDERLWKEIVQSGLIEALLPESAGGAELGMGGLSLMLREQGAHLGRIPLATTAVTALAIATLGGPADVLTAITSGAARVSALMPEYLDGVTASSVGESFVLTGTVQLAYLAPAATHYLVVFTAEERRHVAVIPADRAGVSAEAWDGMSNQQHATVQLTGVSVDEGELVGRDTDSANWVRERLLVALGALQVGVCHEAVRRTAAYTSEREQFGRPLSTNQGVALRAADASIDTEAIALSVYDAAWQLDHGQDAREVSEAVLSAAWWAKDAGFRVVHATQHLHGGMGADLDNHIHRFFLWARELDILWGSAEQLREELGAVVVAGACS